MSSKAIDKISIFLSELLGTALLLFLGCMSCISWDGKPVNSLQIGIAFGMVVMIIIQTFGCVSGAHLNPAVTLAAIIYNLLTVQMACLYFIAQMLGAFMGYGLLMLVTPQKIFSPDEYSGPGLCVTMPHADLTLTQAFAMEYLSTTILILLCAGVWDPRNAKYQDSIPIKFGFAIVALGCAAGPYTGCSMNPARSFGPALWHNDFTAHWIYWAGPLLAAVVTSIVYKTVFRREAEETSPITDEDRKVNAIDIIPLKTIV